MLLFSNYYFTQYALLYTDYYLKSYDFTCSSTSLSRLLD